ncbi:hypothetical protein [Dactylosporangium salmoneum]|uniref:Uncharacterized protein n=1 Tax=Dactylosporangium salmoneum TaxID=53361 RepID=A0ABP5TE85_9ACTN
MSRDTTPIASPSAAANRTVVAVAWPTGRPIYAYTVDELAEGVDLYTRWLKAATPTVGGTDAR